ncbi:MAG: ABC transporter ATP-binding protein [Desulfobulbaceae bacterium]|nr:MAG: ABC transporter ATP-binding protein [Desulfobulbaceae bacterium]
MSAHLFEAVDICKAYQNGVKDVEVLKNINLNLAPGEMKAIIGASGSGKTTLLQILGTLAVPTSGELHFNGTRLDNRSDRKLADFRNESLGFIFQFHHLLPEFSALENVMMPALIAGKSRQSAKAPAQELLAAVELDHRQDHRVNELSGGEQQRAALARALIMEPDILLADEPTGNLDSRAGAIVFDLLHRLSRDRALAVLMVTHNMELANRMDHCLTLRDGALIGA